MASTSDSAEACPAPTTMAAEANSILVQRFITLCIPYHTFKLLPSQATAYLWLFIQTSILVYSRRESKCIFATFA